MSEEAQEQEPNSRRRVLGSSNAENTLGAETFPFPGRRKQKPVRSGLRFLLDKLFGFRETPVTLLILIVYVTVIYLVTSIESGLAPPLVLQGLDDAEKDIFEQSWNDLQEITRSAHPYNSYANDKVHDYLLSSVTEVTKNSGNVIIDADPQYVFFQNGASAANYYESNNILVRIEGSNSSEGEAILFTAHFDSVPTGYGATDAGMGVVTLLGLLRYFAKSENQPQRTVIFNFNNNEEFGLSGARAFTYHPWSNDVEVFLNLEGAGSGGKAILLQGSDYEVTKHYKAVRNPSASSLIEQGWAGGFVKSLTDYTVYTEAGLRGMDIAFYKPRTWYHTKRDSIQGTNRDSLAHMFTSALDVGISFTKARNFESTVGPLIKLPSWIPVLPWWKQHKDDDVKAELEPAVFTDLFGLKFLIVPLSILIALNLFFLIAGPIMVFILFSAVVRRLLWKDAGFRRSLLSLIFGVCAVIGVIHLIVFYNPFIVVAHFVRPFLAYLFAFILFAGLTLKVAATYFPILDQKLGVFMALHNLSWLILAYCTVRLFWNQNNGLYVATDLYVKNCQAVVIGLLGHLLFGRKQSTSKASNLDDDEEDAGGDVEDQGQSGPEDVEGSEDAEVASEETPLLDHPEAAEAGKKIEETSYDWLLQFLSVAGLVYVVYYQFFQVTDALHEGLVDSVDGLRPLHIIMSLFGCILGSLILPFIHKTNKVVWFLLTVSTVWLTCSCMRLRPFTESTPYKVRFHQELHIADNAIDRSFVSARAILTDDYLVPVVQDFPSIKRLNTSIDCHDTGLGHEICEYAAIEPAIPKASWFNITTTSFHGSSGGGDGTSKSATRNSADLIINTTENRLCDLVFDSRQYGGDSPLRGLVINDEFALNNSRGVTKLELRKLDWTSPYKLHLEWASHWSEKDGFIQDLPVTVKCYWNPYKEEHDMIDVPALNEAMAFAPEWVIWSNSQPSLVVMTQEIVI